jgi:hypothetical protein
MTVTVFERIDRPTGKRYDLALDELIGRVRSSAYAEPIAAIRAEADDKRRSAMKQRLPAFMPSGRFTARNAHGLAEHAGTAVFDFDHVPDVAALGAELRACPHVAAGFVSPSGNGYKAILRVEVVDPDTGEVRPPRDDAEHKAAWEAGARLLDTGAAADRLDRSGQDVARACRSWWNSRRRGRPLRHRGRSSSRTATATGWRAPSRT